MYQSGYRKQQIKLEFYFKSSPVNIARIGFINIFMVLMFRNQYYEKDENEPVCYVAKFCDSDCQLW